MTDAEDTPTVDDARAELVAVFMERRDRMEHLTGVLTKMGGELDPVSFMANRLELLIATLMGPGEADDPESMTDTRLAFEARFMLMVNEGLEVGIGQMREAEAAATLLVPPKGKAGGLHLPGNGRGAR